MLKLTDAQREELEFTFRKMLQNKDFELTGSIKNMSLLNMGEFLEIKVKRIKVK